MATLIPENSELKCCDGEVPNPNGSIHVHLKKYPTLRARNIAPSNFLLGNYFNQIFFVIISYTFAGSIEGTLKMQLFY